MMGGYGYGYGPMMGGWGWGGWILMAVLWALVIAGIVMLVVWLVRAAPRHPGSVGPMSVASPQGDEACNIARARYAKGEITKEQYDEICKTLNAT